VRSRTVFTQWLIASLLTLAAALTSGAAPPRGSGFNYQGNLTDGGAPANGNYDLTFRLWDDPVAGAMLAQDSLLGVPVANGLFSVTVSFGSTVFNSEAAWIEVVVNGVPQAPRQELLAVPYALQTRGMFVNGTGRVGIGTLTPLAYLQVEGAGSLPNQVGVHAKLLGAGGGGSSAALRGESESTTGAGIGVWGSQNGSGYGVFGFTPSGRGVYGSTTSGTAVFAFAGGASGVNHAVRGETLSADGYSGYFVGDAYFSGNVGIGNTDPTDQLDVRGSITVRDTDTMVFTRTLINSTRFASVSPLNGATTYVGNDPGGTDTGRVIVYGVPTFAQVELYVDAPSGMGVVAADVKSFRSPNPDDPTTDIVYACIEGPEAAMYVRGTATLVDGYAHVELPRHFAALALAEGMTVQLTPRSADSLGLAVIAQATDTFEVRELMQGRGTYEFNWEAKAVRRDQQDYRVIRDWRDRGDSTGRSEQERWEARLRDIERRERRLAELEGRAERLIAAGSRIVESSDSNGGPE